MKVGNFWTNAGAAVMALSLLAAPGHSRATAAEHEPERLTAQQSADAARARLRQELERVAERIANAQPKLHQHALREHLSAHLDRALAQAEAAWQHLPEHFDFDQQESFVYLDDSEGGWLGVQISEVTPEKARELKLPAERGVLVTEVDADSPAAKSGLRANDVITEYNGQRIEGTAQFRRMVRETPPDRTVTLTVWRDARSQQISAQISSMRRRMESRIRISPRPRIEIRPDFDFSFELPDILSLSTGPRLGISADDLSGQLGEYFGAPGGEGVLVREVTPVSPAEKAGMKAGDVITHIEGTRVRNSSELREQMRANREKDKVSVTVLRKGVAQTLSVEVQKPQPRSPARRTAVRTRV
jgi:serine protease Do